MTQLPSIKLKFDYGLLAKVLALVLVVEGAVLFANAASVSLDGMGGIRKFYIQLAGIQLLILGLVALVALVLPIKFYGDMKPVSKMIGLIPSLVALVAIFEALVVVCYSTGIQITDLGHVRSFGMGTFGAQLFFIGGALLSARILAGKENLGLTVIMAVTLAIGSIGAFFIGVAALTNIEGVGTIEESTVSAIGAFLLAMSVAIMILLYLGDRKFLSKEVFGFTLSTLGIVASSIAASIAGMVILSYAAWGTVQGIGHVPERDIMLFGLSLAYLGMAIPATMFYRVKSNKSVRDLAMYSAVFLLLLFPFALFV